MRALLAALAVAAAGMVGIAGPTGIPVFPAVDVLSWLFWLLPLAAGLGMLRGRPRTVALVVAGLLASTLAFWQVLGYRWGASLGPAATALIGLALAGAAWSGGRVAQAKRRWILAILGIATALALAGTGSLRLGVAGAGLTLGLGLVALTGRRVPDAAPAGVVGGLGLGVLIAAGPLVSATPWWLAAALTAGLFIAGYTA